MLNSLSAYHIAGNFGEHYIWQIHFQMVLAKIKLQIGELNINAINYC